MTGAARAHGPLVALTMLVGTVLLAGCRPLPDIVADDCGNAVLEPPEDCDRFVPEGFVCRPRGTAGQCRFDCRPGPTGKRPSCPAGWGCDGEGICRAPSGTFEAKAEHKVGGVTSLLAGDFDGDGRSDVLTRGAQDGAGQSKIAFHYFDEKGALAATRTFPKLVGTPLVQRLDDDPLADVAFTNELQMVVLVGRGDRSWVPETFGQFRAEKARLRMVAVQQETIQGVTPMLAFTSVDGVAGLFLPSPQTGVLARRGMLPGPLEDLVGDPVAGELFPDPQLSPCTELVFALRGATQVHVADSCRREAGQVVWRDQVVEQVVTLVPPAPIDTGPVIADFNHDGHADLMIGAGGQRPYVALGDGQRLAPAVPFQLAALNLSDLGPLATPFPMPLAAADFTGDGFADYVLPRGLLLSVAEPGAALASYLPGPQDPSFRWTEALIADLNGNGKLDVVAASSARADIDFFNGTGSRRMTHFRLVTGGAVKHLVSEDFDGDLVHDLGYVELASAAGDDDSVMLAFGAPTGPPAAGTPIARVDKVEQLAAMREGDLGQLALVTSETFREVRSELLTFFTRGGDRVPLAPYLLSNFAADRSVQGWASISLLAGHFTGAPRRDVMALSTVDLRSWQFWVIPSVFTAGSRAQRLEVPFDPRLEPATGTGATDLRISVANAAADVDGDRIEDGLWLMPAERGTRCGLVVVSGTDGQSSLTVSPPVVLDRPCLAPRLESLDADGDGRADLALLTGGAGGPDRQLHILWNDGQGFVTRSETLASGSDLPQDFTVRAPGGGRLPELAYVTSDSVRLVSGSATRVLAPARTISPLVRGTGIVAADVTGDGLLDLVVADSGHLGLLRAGVLVQ